MLMSETSALKLNHAKRVFYYHTRAHAVNKQSMLFLLSHTNITLIDGLIHFLSLQGKLVFSFPLFKLKQILGQLN